MSNEVRYLYLRDSKSNRVVTIARQIMQDGETVEFAFSVNRPTTSLDKNGNPQPADRFSKVRGRTIAFGRLMVGNSYKVAMRKDGILRRPIETIIAFLAANNVNVDYESPIPNPVARIASEAYYDMNMLASNRDITV